MTAKELAVLSLSARCSSSGHQTWDAEGIAVMISEQESYENRER